MTVEQIMEVVRENDFNVTFSGGDPLYQPIDELTQLAKAIKDEGYTLWCFTGFLYEQLVARQELREFLNCVEVLVDGPFVEDKRDISLLFRGSSNQRLILLNKSTPNSITQYSL